MGMTPYERMVSNAAACASLCFIAAVVLVAVGLALRARASRAEMMLACLLPECQEAQRYLDALVDTSVDPCSDFYGHVCGKWSRRREGVGFLADSFNTFLELFRERLRTADAASFGVRIAPAIEVSKRLLEGCFTYMADTGSDIHRDVTSVMSALNLAPLLASETSRLALVRAVGTTFATGFHSAVGVRRRKGNQGPYLYLYRSPTLHQEFGTQQADEHVEPYVKYVIMLINGSRDASSIARNVIETDNKISTALEVSDKAEDRQVLPGDLTNDSSFPEGVWSQAFRLFAEGGLKEADISTILITDYDTVGGVFGHLDVAPLRTTKWYLAMTFLAQVLRFDFAKRFRSLRNHDSSYLCFDAVSKAVELHWNVVLRAVIMADLGADVTELHRIFDRVRDNVVPSWLDDGTLALARQKLNETSLEAPAETGTSSGDTADTTYLMRGEEVITTNSNTLAGSSKEVEVRFPGSYVTLRRLTQKEGMLSSPPDEKTAETSALWAQPSAVYKDAHDAVFLPVAYLSRPVYYSYTAPGFAYGTVGATLAKALAVTIAPHSRWNSSATESWWSAPTKWDFSMRLGCLRSMADRDVPSGSHQLHPQASKAFQTNVFAWLRAARASHDALSLRYTSSSKRWVRTEYWLEAQRVFFKRFCLLACGTEMADSLTPLERCTWPLLNMPEFAEVFGCNNSYPRLRDQCSPL